MKKIIFLAMTGLVLAASISSCKKNGSDNSNNNNNNGGGSGSTIEVPISRSDTTSLTMAIPASPISLNFMDPGGLPGGPQLIDTFATKVDEYITPYGFAKKDITKVNVTSMNIVIENSPSQYFNFVKNMDPAVSIKVFVDSFNGTSPKLVASKVNIPANVKELTLDVDPSDIKDYFNADYMKILIGFYTQENEGMDGNTKFRVNYGFKVTAKMP
jgi:hypothetical protein